MSNKKRMFEDARVGDRLYSILHGWGEVTSITNEGECPLLVLYPDQDSTLSYYLDGKYVSHDRHPELYWAIPTITTPSPPLRPKVQWLNLYKDGEKYKGWGYDTKTEANTIHDPARRIALIKLEIAEDGKAIPQEVSQ